MFYNITLFATQKACPRHCHCVFTLHHKELDFDMINRKIGSIYEKNNNIFAFEFFLRQMSSVRRARLPIVSLEIAV